MSVLTTTKQAAVLAPLVETADGPAFLIIKRSAHPQDPHSAQLAFPGGRTEPADANAIETALRETEEEIGVHRQHLEIITQLPSVTTGTGYKIHAVLAKMNWPQELNLQKSEVDSVLLFPLKWLKNPANIQSRRQSPWGELIHYHPFNGEILWGATARIVQDALSALKTS